MAHVDQQTITLRAQAKNLNLKFKLSIILPVRKLFLLSVYFRLHSYIFEIKSKPKPSFSLNPRSLKLKFLQIFKKSHCKRSENKSIAKSPCAHKFSRNNFNGRRKELWILVLAILGCFIVLLLSSFFGQGFIWNYISRAWNYAAPSSGLLVQFSEVIFDWICGSLGF